jgi:hypothetical protein
LWQKLAEGNSGAENALYGYTEYFFTFVDIGNTPMEGQLLQFKRL